MYARVTRFKIKPSSLSLVEGQIPALREKVSAIPGGISNYSMWNADGTGMAVAIYESEAGAEAALPQINGVWGALAEHLTEAPVVETYAVAANMRG